jgi:hypothetical protein
MEEEEEVMTDEQQTRTTGLVPGPPLEERLDALERTFEFMVSALADTTNNIHLRLLGLQEVLEQKGVLTDPEVRARMQAISDVAELKLEYDDDPEIKQFRELRRFVKGKLGPPPEGTGA